MAYDLNVVAWEGWDKRRHGGLPDTPQQAHGLKVLLTNPDDPGDTHQFWTFNLNKNDPFQSWAGWWLLIGSLSAGHGMELSDEPPDFEPPPPDDDYDEPDDDDYDEPPPPPPPPSKPTLVTRVLRRVGKWFRR